MEGAARRRRRTIGVNSADWIINNDKNKWPRLFINVGGGWRSGTIPVMYISYTFIRIDYLPPDPSHSSLTPPTPLFPPPPLPVCKLHVYWSAYRTVAAVTVGHLRRWWRGRRRAAGVTACRRLSSSFRHSGNRKWITQLTINTWKNPCLAFGSIPVIWGFDLELRTNDETLAGSSSATLGHQTFWFFFYFHF